MTPRKAKVAIASFSYGGNGGIKSEVPDVRDWMIKTIIAAREDKRITEIINFDIADTPITMGRNRAVVEARENGADYLIMVDSDMWPDCEPDGKPFWDTSFDFVYNHYEKGPVVVAAPYGGPPPMENMYIFRWRNDRNDSPDSNYKLSQYTREEASAMIGISPVAALPTGLIIYDMRIFDVIPHSKDKGWFYYEWTNEYASEKGSTEDVTATRDMSIIGIQKLGYNPIFCNWDAWAGHWKPYVVRKPRTIRAEDVSDTMRSALGAASRDKSLSVVDIKNGIYPASAYATPEEIAQCQTASKPAEVQIKPESAQNVISQKPVTHTWK